MTEGTTPAVIASQDFIRAYVEGKGGILDYTPANDRFDLDDEDAADLALSLIAYRVLAMEDQTVRDLAVDINLLLRKLKLIEVTEEVVRTVVAEMFAEENPPQSA